ncbi:hypothetical protein ACD631_20855 (plasmid) [Alteromonas macleodii]|uniref:hypothetical protein n=1 Tax=Alteromonas TaxID=226 RepID=UPI00057DEDA8|nr:MULTISPECIES: hypothetical protein [Alteromonas]AUI84797.1 hypothetical protein TE101_20735 [Alteromonas macleodii]KHT51460.1 hypothetical protein RJ43_12375 [Alteromonas macleodii]MCG7639747.1 hypothetical protein [Alteromonas sp. CNT1-28]USI30224.1 hypothetical protein NFG60_21080 [Alteromonas macleodii]CAI3970522.1 hypothetical protein MIT1002_04201 [Alteromonas macleodii]
MTLDKINKLIESINDELIQPANFPVVRRERSTVGFINRKGDENWMSESVFEETLLKLSKCSESDELIVAEDFERVYKSSGKTVRLNEKIRATWQDYLHFCSSNEMISFYVFDHSLRWCGWFNDEYWCLVFENSVREAIKESYLDVELAYQAFPEADSQFKSFIENLYSIS